MEPNAGSDIDHRIEIRDDIAARSMADITPSPEHTSSIDLEIKNTSHGSSPPDMTRATSARTDSRDEGEIDEHARLGYGTDGHNNGPDKFVPPAQKVIGKDTRRFPKTSCPVDFQDFANQQAQPSGSCSDTQYYEVRSQRPSSPSKSDYMIPPSHAVGPPLHLKNRDVRAQSESSAVTLRCSLLGFSTSSPRPYQTTKHKATSLEKPESPATPGAIVFI